MKWFAFSALGVLIVASAVLGFRHWADIAGWVNTKTVRVSVVESTRRFEGFESVRRWGAAAGLKHGPSRLWYEDGGTPRMSGSFVNGKQHGDVTWWRPDGRIERQLRYENGRLIETRLSPPWWPAAEGEASQSSVSAPPSPPRQREGIVTVRAAHGALERQERYENGVLVETRLSVPWWTFDAAEGGPR